MTLALDIDQNFDKIHGNVISYFESNDESLLDDAKQLFSTFINSNRQLQRVKNVRQLLLLLQRRELLGPLEFNMLRIFQKIISDDEFFELVARHQSLLHQSALEPSLNFNHYGNMTPPY
jgi:hypothetical protein